MQPQSQAVAGEGVGLAPAALVLVQATGTHVGHKREHNEDALLADPERRLYAVSDGMGGRPAGEVASATTIATLDEILTGEALAAAAPCQAVVGAIDAANAAVLAEGLADAERHGLGATVVALHVTPAGRGVVAYSGDSRAYLARQGQLDRLTRDHVLVKDRRRLLRRCVGRPKGPLPDVAELALEPGDRVLLCSDGLTDMVSDEVIARLMLAAAEPQAAVDALIEAALEAGGRDNVTVIVLEVSDQPD